MKVHVLFSGSKGNCTYISDGNTSILVDAGGCLKRIRDSLARIGERLENIQGIFVTHEHSDHIKAIYNINKKYNTGIYTTLETARAICTPSATNDLDICRKLASCVMTVSPNKCYELGSFVIKTFPTSHDTLGSIGFVFRSTKDEKALGYATDTGYVTDEMKATLLGVKNVIIESNHDLQMLKNGPYPEYLKERILSDRGHLSNSACAELIRELAESGTMSFTLAHLSEENNLPRLALESAHEALRGYNAAEVRVASAYSITDVKIF